MEDALSGGARAALLGAALTFAAAFAAGAGTVSDSGPGVPAAPATCDGAGQSHAVGVVAGIAPGVEPAELLGRPRRITGLVLPGPREAGVSWIDMRCDYHSVAAVPFGAVWAVIAAYEDYPRHFSNVDRVAVDRSKPGLIMLRQRTVVRVLGLGFPSEYLLEVHEESGSGWGRIWWRSVEDDGSVRNMVGGCYLESVAIDGKDCTYMRYAVSSLVRVKYPLQREIMAAFLDGGYIAFLKELGKAAQR